MEGSDIMNFGMETEMIELKKRLEHCLWNENTL